MTQTALVCLNHHLQPLHTGYSEQLLRFLHDWNSTGWMSVQCLCLHSCSSNPVVQQIVWVWFLNASFQHLESCTGAQPQTETTVNNSIQNTFLRIRQPKYPWGQNDPTWAARCDRLRWVFLSGYTKDIEQQDCGQSWSPHCERTDEPICLHLHHNYSSSVWGSLHPLTRFLCCTQYIDLWCISRQCV